MVDMMEKLKSDDSIRALVLTGAGRAFSAGGDLKFLHDRIKTSPQKNVEIMRQFYSKFLSIRSVPFPTIAAINGHAVGAGLCLAMACDIRIISETAKVGLNFTRIGIPPGMAGSLTLPTLIGTQAAAKMMFTGELIGADEAVGYGLTLKKVPEAKIVDEALALAQKIAAASPVAVRASVKSMRSIIDEQLERTLQREANTQSIAYAAGDLVEGLKALAEKRDPVYPDFKSKL